jgi:hypothetical protein
MLVLAAVSAVAQGVPRDEVVTWLEEVNLWSSLSPSETKFLSTSKPSERDEVQFSWFMESVYTLGWALGIQQELELPVSEASIGCILEKTPGPGEAVAPFVNSCSLRPASEIHLAVETYFDAHASCRASKARGQPEANGYDIEVVQERHRALNWLVCYENAEWDQVATDT